MGHQFQKQYDVGVVNGVRTVINLNTGDATVAGG